MITAVEVRKDAAPQKTHPQVLTISRFRLSPADDRFAGVQGVEVPNRLSVAVPELLAADDTPKSADDDLAHDRPTREV